MVDISVVVPVYNVKDYLDECIESIVRQTFQTIEILIVDDGSIDGSSALCDAWAEKDDRITVIHKENGGLSDARNTGLQRAKGSYIYFLDSDDAIEADALGILYEISKRLQLQVCCFDSDIFSDDGTAEQNAKMSRYYIRQHVYPQVMTGAQAMTLFLQNDEFRTPVQYMFFNRDFLTRNGLSFRKGLIHEDELFIIQVLDKAESVAHLPFQFYHRRIHAGSIMSSRRMAKNYIGYYEAFVWLVNNTLSFSRETYRLCLERMATNLMIVHDDMQKEERKKIAGLKQRVDQEVKANRYFGDLRFRVRWQTQDIALFRRAVKILYITAKTIIPKPIMRRLRAILRRGALPPYQKEIREELKTGQARRVVLICTPEHGNLGDQAIAQYSKQWLTQGCAPYHVAEITINQYETYPKLVERHIRNDDVIVVCGGGWLGNLWFHNEVAVRRILRKFKRNRIIILPQTIYFSDDAAGQTQMQSSQAIYSAHPDLWLCLRDKASYRFIAENHFLRDPDKALYLPDMVLGFRDQMRNSQRNGIAFCIRADKEGVQRNAVFRALYAYALELVEEAPLFISTLTGYRIPREKREEELNRFFDVLAGKRLVVTDRLHCMLFCAVTATPCIAFDNLTQKVSGNFSWISEIPYIKIAHTIDDARGYMEAFLQSDQKFTWEYDFNAAYQKIMNVIREAVIAAADRKGHLRSGND